MRLRLGVTLLFLCIVSMSTNAEDAAQQERPHWFWGVGLAYAETIYRGKDDTVTAIPIISYIGDRFMFFGTFATYRMFQQGEFSASLKAELRFDGYEASDSVYLAGMDEREISLDGGFVLSYAPKDLLTLELEYLHDLASRHKGSETSLAISKTYQQASFSMKPKVSVHAFDKDFVDYYYGVKTKEVTASRARYIGKSAVNTVAGLELSTHKFLGGVTTLNMDYTWYADEITDSPIVDKDGAFGARIIYTRPF